MSSPAQPEWVSLADHAHLPLLHPYRAQAVLLVNDQQTITQADFLRDLTRLRAGLPNAAFVFNVCEDRYYFLLAFCAALLNNSVNLLPPGRQRATLAQIAADYPDCYCLSDSDIEGEIPCINIRTLFAEKKSSENTSTDTTQAPLIPAQQLAAIAFTSGSTGKPSANKKYWGTLAGTARLLAARFTQHLTNPTLVATVPSQHMYGLEMTVMMALQGECCLHRDKPFYPADIRQVLRNTPAPILLISTPIHLRALVNAELPMPDIAGVVSATAPLDADLATATEHCFNTPLREIYGCTEAGSMATRASTQTQQWHLLDGFSLCATDQGFVARAPHLAEAALLQDQLEQQDDEHFLLLGRNADMINVAGKRASLADLSLKLLAIDGVHDGVFFLPTRDTANQRPAALVVSDLPEKYILQQLALHMDPAFLPRPLRKVDRLPRNETGKLTHAALQTLWSQTHD